MRERQRLAALKPNGAFGARLEPMLKKMLIAAAAISLMTFCATAAYAGGGRGGGGGGGNHHHFNNNIWWSLALCSSCHYETQKVRIKFYDHWGNPHFKWVWRDVKVCY
jgi:hypothetical protein